MIPLKDENPTRNLPFFTLLFIVLNTSVFFYGINLPVHPSVLYTEYALTPAQLINNPLSAYPTVYTSMFLHSGIWHLGGNMLYLWIFGDNIEGALGHIRFLIFYLSCGIVAAFAQIFSAPESTIPMIGASGAVSGVLGAYLIFYPRARIRTFVFLGIFITFLRLPAVLLLGVWILGQIISASISNPGSPGVAWFAHLGGFFAGMILGPLLKKPNISIFQKPRTKVKEKPIRIRFRK